VAEDLVAYREMTSLSHQNGVPQIYIDGQIILGFNERALRDKLGITN
jgi:hypothetical protein